MNVTQLVRAWLGDGNAQLGLALDTWCGPCGKRNERRALYWARRAERNAAQGAALLIASILHDSR